MIMDRIQHRRGQKLPPGAKLVARPTRWGNPYQIQDKAPPAYVVEKYKLLATLNAKTDPEWLDPLREASALACYCPIVDDQGKTMPCHAQVLIDLIDGGY